MNILQRIFGIKGETDYTGTAANIAAGISIRGMNIWMMICSALLASIGLDTNSTAVIIGAMLISPLMSPILGAGYSVGVHDKELFVRSVQNLAYITLCSLITSVIYFTITPLGEPTPEILARTQPTVLDIGVAFFGGVAGIVSGSRTEKTNALPGVAIATALMPPLCASGFGLATHRWEIFGGAFYLFFINAVFIALSTYLIVKLLGFPIKTYVEKGKQKRMRSLAFLMLLLISIPSFWFLYTTYTNNKTKQLIQNQVVDDFRKKGNEILKWEVETLDSVTVIKTFFSGNPITETEKQAYKDKLQQLGLKNYTVQFFRMNLTKSEVEKMGTEMTANIMRNIEMQTTKLKDSLQQNINEELIFEEAKALYPNLDALGIGQIQIQSKQQADTIWSAYIRWDSLASRTNQSEAEAVLQRFLKKRLQTDTILLQPVALKKNKQ